MDENGADVYQNVQFDQTTKFTNRVREAVNKALHSGLIDGETASYLIVKDEKPDNIYFLPKIH